MRKFNCYLVLVLCWLFLVGCSTAHRVASDVVRVNLGDEPHSLDPRRARDPNSQMLMRMFFDGLTRIGPDGEPELAVAESVEISDDLTTYRFALRKSYWTNGEPVTASDFAYSWGRILSPDFPSDNAYQLYVIKHAKEVKEGALPLGALGVHAVDDSTLVVELEHPTPYFLQLLASPFFFPVHQKTDRDLSGWAFGQENYVSNGPFSLVKWRHHDQISACKNPTYWDAEKVQLEGIDLFMVEDLTALHLFERGEIHFAGSPMGAIPLDAIAHLQREGKLHAQPRAETAFLRTNVAVKALDHPKVRRALALAIDREAIVKHVTQGGQLPAMALVPPSMCLSNRPYFEDRAAGRARELLEEVLEEGQIARSDLHGLSLMYINSERSHRIAQAIQQQWNKALDIQVGLEAAERKIYFDRLSHRDYQLAYCSWGADFHDPVNFLEVFKHSAQSTNNTGWENVLYTQLLDQSAQMRDARERLAILSRCEGILMEEMPIIPILYYSMQYLKDDRLQGIVLSSMGTLDFKWAFVQNGAQ